MGEIEPTARVLAVVRWFRRLPHTHSFDRHLDDCAAYALLYWPNLIDAPAPSVRHVLRLSPLPNVMRYRSRFERPDLKVVVHA